jgi:hypothetical protein
MDEILAEVDRAVKEVLQSGPAFRANLQSAKTAEERLDMVEHRTVQTAIGIRAELAGIRVALTHIAASLQTKSSQA